MYLNNLLKQVPDLNKKKKNKLPVIYKQQNISFNHRKELSNDIIYLLTEIETRAYFKNENLIKLKKNKIFEQEDEESLNIINIKNGLMELDNEKEQNKYSENSDSESNEGEENYEESENSEEEENEDDTELQLKKLRSLRKHFSAKKKEKQESFIKNKNIKRASLYETCLDKSEAYESILKKFGYKKT